MAMKPEDRGSGAAGRPSNAGGARPASARPSAGGERSPILPSVQDNLARTRLAPDLLAQIPTAGGRRRSAKRTYDVIVEMNMDFPGGRKTAQAVFVDACRKSGRRVFDPLPGYLTPQQLGSFTIELGQTGEVALKKSLLTDGYVFCKLPLKTILEVVSVMPRVAGQQVPLVYKIWLDHDIDRCVYTSTRTIKSDAARAAFAAAGKNIVWAVADTGIDGSHPHFATWKTLEGLPAGVDHVDFTAEYASDAASSEAALIDLAGHGTHVAGIIAGETRPNPEACPGGIIIARAELGPEGKRVDEEVVFEDAISGIAPLCKLVSLKVLQAERKGKLSNLIAAISYVRRVNDYGRTVKIHGVNMSLGYTFEPVWFAAGQSPLCNEVDLLVRAGVIVVVAAGNGGYGSVTTYSGSAEVATHLGTINDPGNSAMAITVGSTHREWPHNYGISYFSGKGPTGDGRMKPDLVAPGERIVSCDIRKTSERTKEAFAAYKEDSGTSMAAPHVSGAAAAFLSVRTEFIGRPQQVKDILTASATDLKRRPEFQGAGLVDVMRALQAV